jgi:ABC-type Mn2+/Zn2+ transport system permease subunit
VRPIGARFALGWGIATLASVVSLFVTAKVDLPIGAAIVCVLGVALVLCAAISKFVKPAAVATMPPVGTSEIERV